MQPAIAYAEWTASQLVMKFASKRMLFMCEEEAEVLHFCIDAGQRSARQSDTS